MRLTSGMRQVPALAAAFGMAVACGSAPNSGGVGPTATAPSPLTTVFQGTIVGGGGQTGTLDVTIQAAVASRARFALPFVATLHAQGVSASGTLRVTGGATTALSGSYNAGTLNLSGGGLSLSGTAIGGVLSGTMTGTMSGGFSSVTAAAGPATRYCGTYTTIIPSQGYREEGTWNIQVAANGTVSGVHAAVKPISECCGYVTGRREGNAVTFVTGEGKTVTGTIQGATLSGSHPNGDGTTSFSGSTNAC